MMTTMTRMMRNMALAPLVTPGRWPLGGWSLGPALNLHRKSVTSNSFLEFAVHFRAGRRSFARREPCREPPGRACWAGWCRGRQRSPCLRQPVRGVGAAWYLPRRLAPGARELIGSALVAGRPAGSRFCITNFMDPDLCDVDAAAAVLAGHGVPLLSGPADRPWASARPCSPMPAVACGNSSRTPPSRIKDLAQR
jgi:hypothetical protein